MNVESWLAGQLARAHMKRSRLKDQISSITETLQKLMRSLSETDTRIYELKGKLRQHSERPAA